MTMTSMNKFSGRACSADSLVPKGLDGQRGRARRYSMGLLTLGHPGLPHEPHTAIVISEKPPLAAQAAASSSAKIHNLSSGGEDPSLAKLRKVFVDRDYRFGFMPVRFVTERPRELRNKIGRQDFAEAVEEINNSMKHLGEPACSEGTFACLTGHLSLVCCPSRYEHGLSRAANLVKSQNENLWGLHKLHVTDPALRGLRVLEITILDEVADVFVELPAVVR